MKEEVIIFLFRILLIGVIAGWALIFVTITWEIQTGLRNRKRKKKLKRFKLSEQDKRIINTAYERRFKSEQGRD